MAKEADEAPISVVLGALTRASDLERTPLEGVLASITETAARVLSVARVNIWLYDAQHTRIVCKEAYDARTGLHSSGEVLEAENYPSYFKALDELRYLAALDAEHDPRSAELRDSYLLPRGISTMLDVPLLRSGKVIGVLCHEHIGPKRSFTQTERLFAANIGDLVALALETERARQAERERAELERRLIRLQHLESLGVLAGGVAHDFRNMLIVVMGHAGLLSSAPDDAAKVVESAQAIDEAARRANELCEQLLVYAGRKELAVQRLALGELVEEMVRLLRPRVPDGVEVREQIAPNLPVISGDGTQLRQVVMNLLVNAFDATAGKGSHVEVRVERAPANATATYDFRAPGASCLSLEIEDDGVGMSAATLSRMFEPFFSTKTRGHGLGLAAVLGIVRSHGGALDVTSVEGAGTTVRIWLPVAG